MVLDTKVGKHMNNSEDAYKTNSKISAITGFFYQGNYTLATELLFSSSSFPGESKK